MAFTILNFMHFQLKLNNNVDWKYADSCAKDVPEIVFIWDNPDVTCHGLILLL